MRELPEGVILCPLDVVGTYPDTSHVESLAACLRFSEIMYNKQMSNDNLVDLSEVVLKNNILEFHEKSFKIKYVLEHSLHLLMVSFL